MKKPSKQVTLMLVAFAAGLALGTWTSVMVAGETAYGASRWTTFVNSLSFSPILMTLALPISPIFPFNVLGVFTFVWSILLAIKEAWPVPYWLMLGGAFLWSLGNATVLITIMGA